MRLINTNQKILIVGLSLLGGSYAKALSKKGFHVSAITLDQKSIDFALDKGWIEKGSARVARNDALLHRTSCSL